MCGAFDFLVQGSVLDQGCGQGAAWNSVPCSQHSLWDQPRFAVYGCAGKAWGRVRSWQVHRREEHHRGPPHFLRQWGNGVADE